MQRDIGRYKDKKSPAGDAELVIHGNFMSGKLFYVFLK